jgi:hypothetical protein
MSVGRHSEQQGTRKSKNSSDEYSENIFPRRIIFFKLILPRQKRNRTGELKYVNLSPQGPRKALNCGPTHNKYFALLGNG